MSLPRSAFLILCVAALAATPARAAAPTAAGEDALRAELQSRLDRDAAAWNRGDLEAFCASYAEDATFVSPKGITRSRAEVLARYRASYPDRSAMGTLTLELLEARPAPTDGEAETTVVSVVARWRLGYPDKPESSGSTLLVLHRAPGGDWQIVQDASM